MTANSYSQFEVVLSLQLTGSEASKAHRSTAAVCRLISLPNSRSVAILMLGDQLIALGVENVSFTVTLAWPSKMPSFFIVNLEEWVAVMGKSIQPRMRQKRRSLKKNSLYRQA